MSRQQKKGPMKPVSVEQEEEQGRPAEEEMEHKDKDEMASREPTLADLTSLFSAHMAKMDSREAVRKQEHIDQERRFKALQHQFSLLQMEVQARTSPTSDACHIDTHSLDVHGAQADTDNQQFTSPNVFHSNADLIDDRFPPPRFREPRLEKLADSDDIEHFLITFERIATACRWPKADWAFHLIPLLTGRARAAYVQMDLDDSTEYDKVKAAILVKYDINAETYRLRFRSLTVLPSEAPKELYTRLKDLYGKWIKPKGKTTEEVGEIIILEQYLRMLSPELQVWIRERDPTTAAEAAALADVFVAARGKNQSWGRKTSSEARRPPFPQFQPKSMAGLGKTPKGGSPEMKPAMTLRRPVVCYLCGQEGHTKPVCPRNVVKPTNLCYVPRGWEDKAQKPNSLLHAITVKVNGKEFPALIDTGSDQTLVSRKVVAPSSVNASNKLSICCVHGDERLVPTADLYLAVNNQPYLLEVGVVDNLPYPVVLGRDLPVLLDLIQPMSQCNMVLTRAKAKQQDEPAQTLSMLPFYNADLETSPPKPKTTRRQRRHAKLQYNASRLPAGEVDGLNPQMKLPTNISELQQNDTSLVAYFEQANQMEMGDKVMNDNCERFMISENILYRQIGSVKQLIVPKEARELVLHLSHSIPWAGHLGVRKTIERIKKYFYWPGLKADVVQYCKSCPECQLVSLHHPPRVPLQPLPLISTPFERLGMDIVGPVEKSSLGNRFLLVITDYATRYPEVFPLKSMKAKNVATCLIQFCSRVGLPREILTDQGTNFMSTLLKQVYQLLGIKSLRTTPYHPQTDGLTERFNQTLKQMLRKFVDETGKNWDQWLPYILFAYREVPQASTGFSPFELLYGHEVRGPLTLLKEMWEGIKGEREPSNVVAYVLQMRERLEKMRALARTHMAEAQKHQRTWYDQRAREREFVSGEKVLVMLPSKENKLLAKWQGPFNIKSRLGPTTYEVATPGQEHASRILHVNLLKKWVPRSEQVLLVCRVQGDEECEDQYLPQSTSADIRLDHLPEKQRRQVSTLCNPQIFSELPGHTSLIQHDVILKPDVAVRRMSYRIPEKLQEALKEEVDFMLSLGIIEPSQNRLGKAVYLTTLDLSKGYWQIPLTERARPLTAFRTPWGLFQFRFLPFGLHGAPATFQRLMDQVLQGLTFAAAYLDDIIIYSTTWEEHMQHLHEVFQRLQRAGLTANPAKCAIARKEAEYLGFVIGNGVVRPQIKKIQALEECPLPQTRKELRSFLGMAGFYNRFIPNFSSRAATLTDMVGVRCPNQCQWTEERMAAFKDIQTALTTNTVLYNPDFTKEFIVQTDASERGLGAVLLQGSPGERRPVVFISRKLFPRETRYSTIEKECLAVKWALDSLRYYLLGREFILETDHKALQWLERMRDTNGRITRWYLAMQPFRFKVHHVPGKANVTADYLSRCASETPEGRGCVMSCHMATQD
ncbi:uncharacterized protein isoform X2 [Danio rerio]|uniref:Gypsy retrotransposon integrase-like protein 1 n=1 Tax=Danio rerio TaxID=7955 RepID=A0AB32T6G0_DANRE